MIRPSLSFLRHIGPISDNIVYALLYLSRFFTPNPKSRQKLSKKNGIELVGYTFRLKNYVKIPSSLSDFLELALPLTTKLDNRQQDQQLVSRKSEYQCYFVCEADK